MTAAGATFPYGIDPNDQQHPYCPLLPACGGCGEGHCRFLHLRKDVCIGEAGRMRYQGMVYRPPSEAYSLIVQVTYGCSHNTCAFCSMYKEKRFALRPLHEVLEDFQMARQRYRSVRRIFLADGDALIRKASELYTILDTIRDLFPECERVTSYASPSSIRLRTEEELRTLRQRPHHGIYGSGIRQ